jgi:hypothetical protein
MAKVPHGALSGHLSSMKSNETYKLSCILAILLQDNDLLRSTKQREKEKKNNNARFDFCFLLLLLSVVTLFVYHSNNKFERKTNWWNHEHIFRRWQRVNKHKEKEHMIDNKMAAPFMTIDDWWTIYTYLHSTTTHQHRQNQPRELTTVRKKWIVERKGKIYFGIISVRVVIVVVEQHTPHTY